MKPDDLTDELLRRYLLGELDETARQEIEGLMLTDLGARETIEAFWG